MGASETESGHSWPSPRFGSTSQAGPRNAGGTPTLGGPSAAGPPASHPALQETQGSCSYGTVYTAHAGEPDLGRFLL